MNRVSFATATTILSIDYWWWLPYSIGN